MSSFLLDSIFDVDLILSWRHGDVTAGKNELREGH